MVYPKLLRSRTGVGKIALEHDNYHHFANLSCECIYLVTNVPIRLVSGFSNSLRAPDFPIQYMISASLQVILNDLAVASAM